MWSSYLLKIFVYIHFEQLHIPLNLRPNELFYSYCNRISNLKFYTDLIKCCPYRMHNVCKNLIKTWITTASLTSRISETFEIIQNKIFQSLRLFLGQVVGRTSRKLKAQHVDVAFQLKKWFDIFLYMEYLFVAKEKLFFPFFLEG